MNTDSGKKERQIRQRSMTRWRLRRGLSRLIEQPAALIILILWLGLTIFVWHHRDTFSIESVTLPSFHWLYQWVPSTLIVVVSFSFLMVILILLGTPWKAAQIDSDVAIALGLSPADVRYNYRPFLISVKSIKGSTAKKYIFWSRYIGVQLWNNPDTKKAVLWALHSHSDMAFAPGKYRYTVELTVGAGITPQERKSPKDPFFK